MFGLPLFQSCHRFVYILCYNSVVASFTSPSLFALICTAIKMKEMYRILLNSYLSKFRL
jgi:hypothetical protein